MKKKLRFMLSIATFKWLLITGLSSLWDVLVWLVATILYLFQVLKSTKQEILRIMESLTQTGNIKPLHFMYCACVIIHILFPFHPSMENLFLLEKKRNSLPFPVLVLDLLLL